MTNALMLVFLFEISVFAYLVYQYKKSGNKIYWVVIAGLVMVLQQPFIFSMVNVTPLMQTEGANIPLGLKISNGTGNLGYLLIVIGLFKLAYYKSKMES